MGIWFFSNLVTPMFSTLTDRIAKPSITQRERQHNMQLVDNFLPAVFKNKPYSHTPQFSELRHKASGSFYKSMFDQLGDTKKNYPKFHQNGQNDPMDIQIRTTLKNFDLHLTNRLKTTALAITSFLATIMQGQRKQLVSDHKNMAYNLTAIFEGLKLISSGIKNMEQPKSYLIWTGLGGHNSGHNG